MLPQNGEHSATIQTLNASLQKILTTRNPLQDAILTTEYALEYSDLNLINRALEKIEQSLAIDDETIITPENKNILLDCRKALEDRQASVLKFVEEQKAAAEALKSPKPATETAEQQTGTPQNAAGLSENADNITPRTNASNPNEFGLDSYTPAMVTPKTGSQIPKYSMPRGHPYSPSSPPKQEPYVRFPRKLDYGLDMHDDEMSVDTNYRNFILGQHERMQNGITAAELHAQYAQTFANFMDGRENIPPPNDDQRENSSGERSGRSRDANWTLSLNQAIQMIPHFDGNTDTLALFCRAVRDVAREYGPKSERWILNSLANKLKGRAAEGYTARLTQYANVESLLSDLLIQYSNIGGADQLLAELKVVRQRPGESAGDYGLRVQSLLNRLLNVYDYNRRLESFERGTYKVSAANEALEQFLFGLLGPLEHQVRSKDPKTLRDAINQAILVENRTSARRFWDSSINSHDARGDLPPPWFAEFLRNMQTIPQTQAQAQTSSAVIRAAPAVDVCNYCNIAGHDETSCKKRINDAKTCEYCATRGHTYAECYSLEKAIRDGRVSKSKLERAPEITSAPVVYASYPVTTIPPVTYSAVPTNNGPPPNTFRQNGNRNERPFNTRQPRWNGNTQMSQQDRGPPRDQGYNSQRRDYGPRENNFGRNYNNDGARNYNNRQDNRDFNNRRGYQGRPNNRSWTDYPNNRSWTDYPNNSPGRGERVYENRNLQQQPPQQQLQQQQQPAASTQAPLN